MTLWTILYRPWNSLRTNTGVGSLSLLQGVFPTQGSNPGLLCCRQILYQLSHKGSPRILEWVACPFSSGSSQPGINQGLLHCRRILYQLSYQGSSFVVLALSYYMEKPSKGEMIETRRCFFSYIFCRNYILILFFSLLWLAWYLMNIS